MFYEQRDVLSSGKIGFSDEPQRRSDAQAERAKELSKHS